MRALLGMAAVLLPMACTDDVSVFGRPADDDGEGGQGGSTTSAQGGADTTSGGTSSGGSASGGASSSGGTTSAGGATSTTGSTSGQTSTTATTSGGGVKPTIPCGAQTCTGGDVCCVSDFDYSHYCASPGQCPSTGYTEVSCNGPMDCEQSEVCCGHFTEQDGYLSVACEPSCQNAESYYGITMCGDDPTTCSGGEQCYQSQSLPQGHGYCQ